MATSSRHPNFAERNGATVLLSGGVLLIVAAVAAVFTGHEMVAAGIAVPGVLAVLIAAILSRMEGPFHFLGMSGHLRPVDSVPVAQDATIETPTKLQLENVPAGRGGEASIAAEE